MNTSRDRAVLDWLADGPDHGPSDGLARVFAVTRRTRKRPRWTFPERWLPMQLSLERGVVPRGALRLVVVAAVLVALVIAVVVGSQLDRSPVFPIKGNGLIVYGADLQLFVLDANGTNPRPFLADHRPAEAASFSPDGTRVAFWRPMIGGNHLWVADLDGQNLRQVSKTPHSQRGIPDPAVWSADGREVLYSTLSAVYRAAVDGSTPEFLIGRGSRPRWSPDGQWIAYRQTALGKAVLVIVRPDRTGEFTVESDDREAFHGISWSPDSSRVATHRNELVTIVGPEVPETVVSRTGERSHVPAWSPDGRWIAYLANPNAEEHRAELRLLEVATGAIVDGTSQLADCWWPTWSPDATRLLAWGPPGDCSHLMVIRLTEPTVTRPVGPAAGLGTGPEWQGVLPG